MTDDHRAGIDWMAIVASLAVGISAAIYVIGQLGGVWRRQRPVCRFCGLLVDCPDPHCQADTHSHDTCADVFDAGVRRGVALEGGSQISEIPEPGDDIDEDLEDDELDEEDPP